METRRSKPCPPTPAILCRFAKAVLFALCGGIDSALEQFQVLARAEEVHQGGKAAPSCRLCLTACNSRQFDEVTASTGGPNAR
jgi:hypothetical protein